ncbi:DUF397 domain-containing protein [Saccharopolyspora sp. ASAGF58]|nr:DUF397 domain-containing protein [Saccharopolyspora sp. ASAGF58]
MADSTWRKSSHSGTHNCVEVGRVGDGAAVRDTKNHAAGYFTTTTDQWSAFIASIRNGRYDDLWPSFVRRASQQVRQGTLREPARGALAFRSIRDLEAVGTL